MKEEIERKTKQKRIKFRDWIFPRVGHSFPSFWWHVHTNTQISFTSLVPRPCAFITCSMEFCVNFVLHSNECTRPGNKAIALPGYCFARFALFFWWWVCCVASIGNGVALLLGLLKIKVLLLAVCKNKGRSILQKQEAEKAQEWGWESEHHS